MTISHQVLITLLSLAAVVSTCIAAPREFQLKEAGLSDNAVLALRKYLSHELASSQQQCATSGFDVTLPGSPTYTFVHCRNWAGTMYCYNVQQNVPPNCNGNGNFGSCYNINWHTTTHSYTFKICNDFGSYCMTSWNPHLTGNCDRQDQAQVEQVTLCEELPDGSKDCKSSDSNQATQQLDNMAAMRQQYEGDGCFCITTPQGDKICEGQC